MKTLPKRKCIDCGILISYDQFCHDHPTLQTELVQELWDDPIFSFYCVNCFLNRPERPFHVKRREYSYLARQNK